MYKYKHINGEIINKPDRVMWNTNPEEYFEGGFVVAWVHISDLTREIDKYWPLLSEEQLKEFADAKQD